MIEFVEFKKIPRLSRECIVTEKIDGTNACIFIGENGEFLTGSRSGWITPDKDNFGFSRWANENKEDLMRLGVGQHFGEWWGQGIQRNYGLKEKRFSLFNTYRWCLQNEEPKLISVDPKTKEEKYQQKSPKCCFIVPVLYTGIFDTLIIEGILQTMKEQGSRAVPGFMKPEGVVIYHRAGNIMFKKTIDKDEEPKSIHWGGTK